jgi:hypothetical protein
MLLLLLLLLVRLVPIVLMVLVPACFAVVAQHKKCTNVSISTMHCIYSACTLSTSAVITLQTHAITAVIQAVCIGVVLAVAV